MEELFIVSFRIEHDLFTLCHVPLAGLLVLLKIFRKTHEEKLPFKVDNREGLFRKKATLRNIENSPKKTLI